MKLTRSLLLASLLLGSATLGSAGEPLTIPPEIAQHMKKGSKLVRLWIAPGFDGNKGFKLGQIRNETDVLTGVVQDYFPYALRKFIKGDSPYVLHLAIVSFQQKTSGNSTSARLEVEGRLVDTSGTLVAAFIGYALETIGGNANDNARYAVNRISFAMAKDLMEFALPKEEKAPAVIVAAPAPAAPAPATAPTLTPAPIAEAASAGIAVPASPAKPLPAPVPLPTAAPATAPAAPAPAPVPAAAEPAAAQTSLIPPTALAEMKPGAALGGLWIHPAYVKASGFSIGEVRYRVQNRNDGIDKVLPESLAEIAKADAPCQLELQVVELMIRSQTRGVSNVALGVEGRLVAKDGTVMAAFKTRESVTGIGDLVDDCRLATRKVVRAIVKDLR